MCIAFFALNAHPTYSFIFAHNRDEFYQRPTATMDYWQDYPHVLAGRDLVANGTWLGVNKQGLFAALSNIRNPANKKEKAISRGKLIADFLIEQPKIPNYINQIQQQLSQFNGFNLLLGNLQQNNPSLYYLSSTQKTSIDLSSGIYGLSNAELNSNWPKINRGKKQFTKIINDNHTEAKLIDALFTLMEDTAQTDDESLPNTGVGIEIERLLSPVFIKSDRYGTRTTTIILINQSTKLIIEKTHAAKQIKRFNF